MQADPSGLEAIGREQFACFYEETAPALRRYLARLAADGDVTDDLLQEAYIRLIHAAPAGEAQRRAYLYRTATNLAMDHFRTVRRAQVGLSFWKRSQPCAVETRDAATGIERAFRLLSVRERALLWLAYVEDAKHAEIAAALGLGEKSVRVLLFRARRRMERLLRETGWDGGGR